MTAQTRSVFPRRAWQLLGLLLVGLGAAHCRDPVDPPPPEEEETRSLPALARDAHLLQVDEAQRFLLSVRADGTYVQNLPDGAPVRIADAAEGADITSDSQTVLLWSRLTVNVRTLWLWRPGTPEAIVLSQKARDAVIRDAALSYVAFIEEDDTGTAAVRLVRTASCIPGDCVLQTPLQVQGGKSELQGGGITLSVVNGVHRWLISVSSGAVTDLGDLPALSFVSPTGTRYGWVEDDHVRMFESATGTQVWDQVIPDKGYTGWKVTRAFMLGERSVFIDAEGVMMGAPPGWPATHLVNKCGDQGCTEIGYRTTCHPSTLAGQPSLWCPNDWCTEVRCSDPGIDFRNSEGTVLYTTGEMDIVLGPVFSQGFSDAVRLKGRTGQLHSLEWSTRGTVVSKLALDAPYPTAPIQFLPDKKRLVFHQQVFESDGTARGHLWTWDRAKRVDLGRLEGKPGPASLVRDNPPTFYLDTEIMNADGTSRTAIVRVKL